MNEISFKDVETGEGRVFIICKHRWVFGYLANVRRQAMGNLRGRGLGLTKGAAGTPHSLYPDSGKSPAFKAGLLLSVTYTRTRGPGSKPWTGSKNI